MQDHRFLTLGEVARWLNVSGATVQRLVQSEQLPGQRVAGQWRFDPEAVEDWLSGIGAEAEEERGFRGTPSWVEA